VAVYTKHLTHPYLQLLKIQVIDVRPIHKLSFEFTGTYLLTFKLNFGELYWHAFFVSTPHAPPVKQLIDLRCSLVHGKKQDTLAIELDRCCI